MIDLDATMSTVCDHVDYNEKKKSKQQHQFDIYACRLHEQALVIYTYFSLSAEFRSLDVHSIFSEFLWDFRLKTVMYDAKIVLGPYSVESILSVARHHKLS